MLSSATSLGEGKGEPRVAVLTSVESSIAPWSWVLIGFSTSGADVLDMTGEGSKSNVFS